MCIKKCFLMVRVVKNRGSLTKGIVESPLLEISKNKLDKQWIEIIYLYFLLPWGSRLDSVTAFILL